MNNSCIVIGFKDDLLVNAVVSNLKANNIDIIWAIPNFLADVIVSIDGDTLYINEQAIGAIFFRCPISNSFSQNFEPPDRYFANIEVRSIWLAALHLSSVRAINRFDPATWFEDANWLVTRRWLMHHGIQVSPFTFGNIPPENPQDYLQQIQTLRTTLRSSLQALTAASLSRCIASETYIAVCGKILGKDNIPENVSRTQDVLAKKGIRFAELTVDKDDCILYVNAIPNVHPDQISHVTEIITRFYCDDLYFRGT